ncbi:MAG: RsmE family RNA methyltransferase [Opitutales bacterium]
MLYSYFDGNLSGAIVLDEDESRHLISVRRGRAGDSVTVLDGKGGSALSRIEEARPHRAVLRVESVRCASRATSPLWLAQAMPLGKTMETIVQKAAELGAERVIPLFTERSELRLDAERAQRRLARWRQGAVEAVKQCGNPFLPRIDPPTGIAELLALPLPGARMVCSLESGARPFLEALMQTGTTGGLLLAIGPEGDFSEKEYAALRNSGFVPVSLGPLVLRSDTAATASLAIASEAMRFAACSLCDKV